MNHEVRVVPHDPRWREIFEDESRIVAAALGPGVVRIHHAGSTAIAGIHAKPIIDMLVEVDELESVDARNASMSERGYEAMGEYGIAGRRYFRKHDASGIRRFHVHVFLADSAGIERHLAFRDYMIAHPDEAHAYSTLKQRLAIQHPDSMSDYADGKDAYVREMEARALRWQRGRTQ